MKIPSPFEYYPPNWSIFDRFVVMVGAEGFGFAGSAGDVNRFAARYRAAKCFKSVEFDDLTSATANAYSELVRLLLTYSAFEHLLRCLGLKLQTSHNLFNDDERVRTLDYLRRLNGQGELFTVLKDHLDPNYRRQVDQYLSNQPCNPLYLAAGIRHAFAHGKFTASPGNVPQQSVSTVCRYFCRVLFRIMDREFSSRMIEFYEDINSR
jgi:hypothetical protein